MPIDHSWSEAVARDLRRLERRLRAELIRRARARRAGRVADRLVSLRKAAAPVGARASGGGGVRVQPGVRVGPTGRLLRQILGHYPKRAQLVITSAFRPGPGSHHGGLVFKGSPTAALDIAASNGAVGMRDVAKWLYNNFAGNTVELIHTTPFNTDRGFYVKDLRKYPGGGPYDAQTRREHRDHVHFATSKALAQKILARLKGQAKPKAVRPSAEAA